MIIKIPDNTYAQGKSLNALPYVDLTCDELSEVYAYLLVEYGISDPRPKAVLDELRKRENKLNRLEDEVTFLKTELEHVRNETVH